MSLKTLETKWKVALISILEELTESQYKKMLFDLDRIPQGVKADKVREEMPQIIIQYYGTEVSISVIEKEMKLIPRMDATVQDLLRPFVDKLKKQRQKNKEMMSKAAADSGSVSKRPNPAADRQKSSKSDETDPVAPVKQKKTEKKPAGSSKPSETDPVAPVKQKKTEKKPAGSSKPSKSDPVAPVRQKKKTEKKPAGSSKPSEERIQAQQPTKPG